MGSLERLRIILIPSGIAPSGHPQIVLNYGRNAGVRNARGHRPRRAFGRWYESAGSRGGQAFHYGMRQDAQRLPGLLDDISHAAQRGRQSRNRKRLESHFDVAWN
jgi:hypothetical protein